MGPLAGFKIIELAGIGPGPFCGMMLSDMGAEVIRVERLSGATAAPKDVLARNRKSIALDLKQPVVKLVKSSLVIRAHGRRGCREGGRVQGERHDDPLHIARSHIQILEQAGRLQIEISTV